MDQAFKTKLKNSTPVFSQMNKFEDADDEMREIASHIKRTTQHNEYVEPERIKFLYTNKPKKEGTRYGIFDLMKRSDLEKMIENRYDFILTVFYDVWKDLEPEHKVMSLDKALCGVDMGSMENPKITKKAPDSKEYIDNMKFYGADQVMETSEIIDLACQRIVEDRKEQLKLQKEAKASGKKSKKQAETV
jgi:hypothetical protein